MADTVVSAIARWALTLAGGWLISRGYLDAGDADALISAVVALAAIAWSILAKRRAAQVTEARVAAAETAPLPELAPMVARVAEAATEAKGALAAIRAMVPR